MRIPFALAVVVALHGFAFNTVKVEAAVNQTKMQTAIANLEQRVAKVLADREVAGLAIGIVQNDKLIYAKGFGPRQVGKPEQIDPDTVFQLASVSKAVSATVVAGLVGRGKISWDSKISDLDPSFALYDDYVTRELTIRDMYAHRSGLPEHAGDLLEDMGYKREEVLNRLRYQLPFSSFRSHYEYTNFGLTEGAVAAAKAYGLTWEDAAEKELFTPLSMSETSTRYSDFVARPNHASSHVRENGVWVHKVNRQPDAQSPAGGVSSSVNDLAKWMRLRLANGKFEGKQSIAEEPLAETDHPMMLTGFNPVNHLPNFYGLGMNVNYDQEGRLRLGHSGAFALGNATAVSMVPAEQLGVMVLTNTYPVGIAEALNYSFLDDAIYGKQTRDWFALFKKIFADPSTLGLNKTFDYSKAPLTVLPPQSMESYVGKFTNNYYGDVTVEREGDSLLLAEGPAGMKFPLKHYSRDTFTYTPPGENSPGLAGITFSIGPDGKASKVQIENLDEFGQGTFNRAK